MSASPEALAILPRPLGINHSMNPIGPQRAQRGSRPYNDTSARFDRGHVLMIPAYAHACSIDTPDGRSEIFPMHEAYELYTYTSYTPLVCAAEQCHRPS